MENKKNVCEIEMKMTNTGEKKETGKRKKGKEGKGREGEERNEE